MTKMLGKHITHPRVEGWLHVEDIRHDLGGNLWISILDSSGFNESTFPLDRNGARELRDWLAAALNDDVDEPDVTEVLEEGDGAEVETDFAEPTPPELAPPALVYYGTDGGAYQLDRGATPDDKREKALLEALLKLSEKPKGQLSSSSLRPVERTWS